MSKPDLDALEKLLVTEAADPFAFVEAAPALLAMARRTERLETELHNYETNHGARCDAEQERYATIAESACRVLVDAVDRLREMMRIDVGDDLSDAVAGLLRDLSAHASAPGHEVPSLRAKIAARDAALGACTARIAELLAQVGALTERRDALLALVASISQTTPLASELEGWEGQRAALVAEVGTLRARVAEAERVLAEERARLADQAAAHEDEIRRQAAVAERVAANATKERARAERAERDRDESRAALAEARREVLGALLLWTMERREAEVAHRPVENIHRRTLDETWRQVVRKLEGMLAGATAPIRCTPGQCDPRGTEQTPPARRPLDPAHVEVLRGMMDEERANLAASSAEIRHCWAQRIAALEATLGEGSTRPTPEDIGPHAFAGDGFDCARCGEGSQHYIHTDRGEETP